MLTLSSVAESILELRQLGSGVSGLLPISVTLLTFFGVNGNNQNFDVSFTSGGLSAIDAQSPEPIWRGIVIFRRVEIVYVKSI